MTTISVEEAQAKLPELIGGLAGGGELAIARLVGELLGKWERPGPGLAVGIFSIAKEDEEHPRDFAEYMP